MRIILDTDPGLDDAMTFVLASVLTDIVGITTVAGNVHGHSNGHHHGVHHERAAVIGLIYYGLISVVSALLL